MCIPSIRCGLPFCGGTEEEQTSCSLYTRIAAVALGGIMLLVGILALSGIPELRALGTIGSSVLVIIGGLTLLAGVCLRYPKDVEQIAQQDIQNNNPNNVAPQKSIELKNLFHQGESWVSSLVKESSDYIACKLVIAVKTKGKTTEHPYIVTCNPNNDTTVAEINSDLKQKLKLHFSNVLQGISHLEMDSDIALSCILLTKSKTNQFGIHCERIWVNGNGGTSNPKYPVGEERNFAPFFKSYGLEIKSQLDDNYNFI